jgi:hypothetical protein
MVEAGREGVFEVLEARVKKLLELEELQVGQEVSLGGRGEGHSRRAWLGVIRYYFGKWAREAGGEEGV